MSELMKTILIIDDNPADRETFRRYLRQDPENEYRFIEADCGEQALAAYLNQRPDGALLSCQSKRWDALELLGELLAATGEAALPVVILADELDAAVAVQAVKGGAQDYLVKKQATAETLCRAVRYAMDRVAMRREIEVQRLQLESHITALER